MSLQLKFGPGYFPLFSVNFFNIENIMSSFSLVFPVDFFDLMFEALQGCSINRYFVVNVDKTGSELLRPKIAKYSHEIRVKKSVNPPNLQKKKDNRN